jgi:hypothetical protein
MGRGWRLRGFLCLLIFQPSIPAFPACYAQEPTNKAAGSQRFKTWNDMGIARADFQAEIGRRRFHTEIQP